MHSFFFFIKKLMENTIMEEVCMTFRTFVHKINLLLNSSFHELFEVPLY